MDTPMIGEIRLAAFDAIPRGWAACDGQLLPVNEYRSLFEVLGTRFGGDGRRTFALPDLRGRVAIHADGVDYVPGASGGASSHALTVEELPPHAHDLVLSAPEGGGWIIESDVALAHAHASGEATEWTAIRRERVPAAGHENMQPYLGLVFMIALDGHDPAGS